MALVTILTLLLAVSGDGINSDDHDVETVRIPVQVDQAGTSIFFAVSAYDDVAIAAVRFCSAHLPGTDQEECAQQLVSQISIMRGLRDEAQQALPSISFVVRSPTGEELRFVHEEGANPAVEAQSFCREHYESVPSGKCVEAMLENMQRAFVEVQSADT